MRTVWQAPPGTVYTPLSYLSRYACEAGDLQLVQILSSFSSDRARVFADADSGTSIDGEQWAEYHGFSEVIHWLRDTQSWVTPLHHAELLTEVRYVQ